MGLIWTKEQQTEGFSVELSCSKFIYVGYCCRRSFTLGELCLLGYQIMTIPVWDEIAHKSGRLIHLTL